MKGLIIKDFKLLMMNKTFFLIMLVICGFISLTNENDPTFIISFMTFITAVFTISTISYDDFNNGMPFLLTLPITRKLYAAEKYVFGMLTGAAVWFFSVLLVSAVQLFSFSNVQLIDILCTAVINLFISYLILYLIIPIQIKYGNERGRLVLFLVVVITIAMSYVLSSLIAESVNIRNILNELTMTPILLILIGLVLLGYYISSRISIHIMEKKQY